MRRLLATLLVAFALPVIPTAAAPVEPAPSLVPGQITLGDAKPTLASRYEAMATTPDNVRILRAIEGPLAAADDGEYRLATVFVVPDMDGDGAWDLLVYDSSFSFTAEYYLDGDVAVTLVSGRTGRQRWRKYYDDLPVPMIYAVKVGDGRPGLLLVGVGTVENNGGFRFVAHGGRGEVVYDRSVSEADGLGQVQFGGLFDANAGGGTDILVGRVQRIGVSASIGVAGLNWQAVDLTQAFVLDGRDGKYRAVSERELAVGGMPAFVAGGDHDGDKRDDYLVFRLGLRERGSITARSVSENRLIWVNDSTPIGRVLFVNDYKNMVGNAREDIVYWTRTYAGPLLKIPGVTDEMTIVSGSPAGDHGVLLDGHDGTIEWDRWDAAMYVPWADVNRDGRAELMIVSAYVNDKRGGLRFAMTTGAGNELYERDVSLPVDVPLVATAGGWLQTAGDLDADGVPDLHYSVTVGSTDLTAKRASGFLLARTGATIPTTDFPLRTTLDGRGDDRYGWATTKTSLSLSPRDGRTGRSYWRTTLSSPSLWLINAEAPRARGRCGGVFVLGAGTRDQEGNLWMTLLDGANGRVVWARALLGRPDPVKVTPHGGTTARCA